MHFSYRKRKVLSTRPQIEIKRLIKHFVRHVSVTRAKNKQRRWSFIILPSFFLSLQTFYFFFLFFTLLSTFYPVFNPPSFIQASFVPAAAGCWFCVWILNLRPLIYNPNGCSEPWFRNPLNSECLLWAAEGKRGEFPRRRISIFKIWVSFFSEPGVWHRRCSWRRHCIQQRRDSCVFSYMLLKCK